MPDIDSNFPKDIGFHKDYSHFGPRDPVSDWIHHPDDNRRSHAEQDRRSDGTMRITEEKIGSALRGAVNDLEAHYLDIDEAKSAVMGIMEAADDLYFFHSNGFLVFRRFAGLPPSQDETQELWNTMNHLDRDGKDQTRILARKGIREELWRAVNESIDESKRRFTVRGLSGDDVNDLEKGIHHGTEKILNYIHSATFADDLQKRGLLSLENATIIKNIINEVKVRVISNRRYPEEVIDYMETLHVTEIYDGVLTGGCKTLEECIVYHQDKFFPNDKGKTVLRKVINKQPITGKFPAFENIDYLYLNAEHDDPEHVEDI